MEFYYFRTFYQFPDDEKRQTVFSAIPQTASGTWSRLQRILSRSGTRNVRDSLAYLDMKTQLVDEFLLMTDRLSMAHSLETRVPFLDKTLMELVLRIPASVRTREDNVKYLLKRAVGDLLPDSILHAGKRGFVIPIHLWLRGPLRPLVNALLSPERLARQGIFREDFYHSFVSPHLDGRADYTWRVWAALTFQLWYEVFIQAKCPSKPAFTWRDLC